LKSPEFIPDSSSVSSSNGENTLNNISISEIAGLDSETSFTASNKNQTKNSASKNDNIMSDKTSDSIVYCEKQELNKVYTQMQELELKDTKSQ
jgi:hypothetical protein